ncbi:MAG: aspartate--tRNA(Asn) ligase [Spirochaetaceae bacterium]|nr:MAG: aspartate--tRNA(Asn) ligase [Spirochaetaceae bacterium]
MRVLARDLARHDSATVSASGWVHRIRELGAISFVLLRDRSGIMQLVYEEKVPFTLETVITVTGTVAANEKAPGGFELRVSQSEVLAPAQSDLPLAVNQDLDGVSIDAILDNRLVSLRNPKIRRVFSVQSAILKHFADYLRSQDFTEIKTSKLIGTGTEGGTGLFSVDYFEDKVYLAQSPQFYKQAMVASGMERVFEIGTAYRAEKHDTPRHLNEYVSLDVEMAFIESEYDLMDLEIEILAAVFAGVQADCAEVLELHGATVPTREQLAATPRISHDEAKEIATKRLGHRLFEINPEAERALCDWALEEHGVEAVFVTAFPRKKRPFYTYPDDTKTRSFDLLFRGLEITTGGKRIHQLAMLLETLPKFGLTEEGMADYLQIFRYGAPPHGGFAIGLERLTQKILGLQNVKEASLFPRDRRRVRP